MSALIAARVIEVTDGAGCTHLVTEDRFRAGCRAGCFVAMCEAHILAAGLTVEELQRCSTCVRKVAGRGHH